MKISTIRVHNFRSIIDSGEINIESLSLLVGANNSGKSNFIDALRVLYEDLKYDKQRDFPKPFLQPEDDESWIDVEFNLTDNEYKNLVEYARFKLNKLKIRKYFFSSVKERYKSAQSNIFAYEKKDKISKNIFYGAKNVSEAKIGQIIFIPSISKTEEILKTTGPSPLRNIATFVFSKISKKSSAFTSLQESFDQFNEDFSVETSSDGYSLKKLEEEMNNNLKEWQVTFGINIKPLKIEEIIKNLLDTNFKDGALGGEDIDINNYGMGLQRHVIFTLIKLSAKYVDKKSSEKKEFLPDFTLILFEEPEAFLHPAQQEILSNSLRQLSKELETQILLSTHSPLFVSKNIEDLSSIIRLIRKEKTEIFQVTDAQESVLFGDNAGLIDHLESKVADNELPANVVAEIQKLVSGDNATIKLEEEALRFFLWLNSERCSLFFADFIIICEGVTEKAFIDYLINTEWEEMVKKRIYILDVMGKYNFHRYMNLFKLLGMPHSILLDKDSHKKHHTFVNEYIESSRNDQTKQLKYFDPDFEGFLEISKPLSSRNDKKPLNVFWNFKQGNITTEKIQELKNIIQELIE